MWADGTSLLHPMPGRTIDVGASRSSPVPEERGRAIDYVVELGNAEGRTARGVYVLAFLAGRQVGRSLDRSLAAEVLREARRALADLILAEAEHGHTPRLDEIGAGLEA
jgi:hypothetical protein